MIRTVRRFASCISNYFIRTFFFFAIAFAGSFSVAQTSHAAVLYFSPASGSYAVGKTFTVNIVVGTPDQPANAYFGTVSYPTDKLEITSIGKAGSIVSFWSQEPSYSPGKANFEGVTFSPGYLGGAGRIATITFKAKAAGVAAVRFSSGAVYANDGQATNILSDLGGATFTITGGAEPTPPPEAAGAPSAPRVSSTSHPDSSRWYAASDATFRWSLPAGVDAVNILADPNPSSDPGTSSDGLFSSHTYEDVQDGVWYFHVRIRNAQGWSPVSHYKFQIDTKKPDAFTVTDATKYTASPSDKIFRFEASDSGSGIDHYEIRIDGGTAAPWTDDGTHLYPLSGIAPGDHVLYARAVDRAGNFLESSLKFSVAGLAPPTMTEYPRSPRAGDALEVGGVSLPDSKVTVWIQKAQQKPSSYDVVSDAQGAFAYTGEEKLELATYLLWATVTDSRGHTSAPSERVVFSVKPAVFDVSGFANRLFGSIGFYLALILVLFALLAYLYWKFSSLKKELGYDVRSAQEALHKTFDLLADDIQDQVKMLEKAKSKRELTVEEGRILKKLKQDLKVAEEYIRKRINAIERRR